MLTLSSLLSDVVDLTFTVRPIFAQQELGLSSAQYGYFEACRGICQLASRFVSEFTIKRVGGRSYTLISHLVCASYHGILAAASRPVHLLMSYPPMMLGGLGVRSSALVAMHQREGAVQGLGVGETAAGLRLLSSLLSIVWTPLYGWIYGRSPSALWVVAGGFAIASSGVFALTPLAVA